MFDTAEWSALIELVGPPEEISDGPLRSLVEKIADRVQSARWVIDFSGGEVLLANNREHWTGRAEVTAQWRQIGFADTQGVPVGLSPSALVSRLLVPPGANLPDTTAWFPMQKALVDGMVDRGLWPNDTGRWIVEDRYLPASRQASVKHPTVRVGISPLLDPDELLT